MELHKSMPHSDELERSLLGACVHFPSDRAIACGQLMADDFYSTHCATLFGVMRALLKRGSPCDELLLRDACSEDANVVALLDSLPIGLHPDIDALCVRLKDLSAARRLTRAALSVASSGIEAAADPAGFLDRASSELTLALKSRDSGIACVPLGELCQQLLANQVENRSGKPSSCLETGIAQIDGMVGGLEPGRLYVVAGRPGMGKSALAVQLAEKVATSGHRAILFSIEMPSDEIALRMACSAARIDSRALTNNALSELEWRRFAGATEKLSRLPVSMVDSAGLTVEQIARVARQQSLKEPIGLVVVDYLQLLHSSRRHESNELELSEISRELKILARELKVPVIAVSQLNREVEHRSDKRPLMSDLRGSGAIEQDADVILMLYRDDYYDANSQQRGICEVIVAKNRSGETGIVRIKFEARFTRFGDL